MAVGKKDQDIEWPTFDNGDIQVSYSPGENEKIFTDFKPATEFHNIRNTKRKPKKKTKALRLISESEINKKKQSCLQDRKRCIVISVLIVCVVIIVAICIFLGIYFGVIVKGKSSSDQSHSDSSVDVVTLSTTKVTSTITPKPTTKLPTTTTSTKKPTTTSKSTTTTKKTTTTSTTTSTTSTTTTTTTTTTPAPTEPPVKQFSGSQDDIDAVVAKAQYCREKIIFLTDKLDQKQKCRLYYDMLRCVYVRSIEDMLHVPVDKLGDVVETNKGKVFPLWIEIDPVSCRANGVLDIANISTLPLTPAQLCSSPDAVMYYGTSACEIVHIPDALETETDENKCRIRWGVIGCVSNAMSCQFEETESVINLFESDMSTGLHTANQSLCSDLYTSISQSSPCSMTLYTHMDTIFTTCSRVIQEGSQLDLSEMACTLFEVFFECSYSQIPSTMRYEQCQREKDSLRSVSFDIADTASKVNSQQHDFVSVSSCIDTPMPSTYICESPKKLVTVVDTDCYKKFNFVTESTICKYLSEYIYQCGPKYLEDIGSKCSASQIKDAMISESVQMYDRYGINISSLASRDDCIVPV